MLDLPGQLTCMDDRTGSRSRKYEVVFRTVVKQGC